MPATLRISFESDWHVGSGAGIPGYIDRTIHRDADGLPCVPAKSVTGMLRDAAEFVAEQGAGPEAGKKLVEALFGLHDTTGAAPATGAVREAKLWIGTARYAEALRQRLSPQGKGSALADALTFIQPGVAMDPKTGRAEDKKLFLTEQVRGGAVLEAPLALRPDASPLTDDETLLLQRACKALRRIGGGRRRGAGRCTVTWHGDLETAAMPAPLAVDHLPASNAWRCIDVTVTLQQPLIVRRAVLGNEVRSLDYLPGTLLLPLLTTCLANVPDVRTLIARGQILVTPLRPGIAGQPAMPVPAMLSRKKGEDGAFLNTLVAQRDPEAQYKSERDGWAALDGGTLTRVDSASLRQIRMHNVIDDAVQRPTEAVGGVYAYQAIRPGLVFRGQVRIAPGIAVDPAALAHTLSGENRLGYARKGEYGGVAIHALPGETGCDTVALHESDGCKYLIVHLLSDVLLRDAFLHYTAHPDALKTALATALKVSLSPMAEDALGGSCALAARGRRTDTWHTKWQRPRATLTGLHAGGVFAYRVDGAWDGERAAGLMRSGIGDRRAEGYGQIALNPAYLLTPSFPPGAAPLDATGAGTAAVAALSPEDAGYLQTLELAYWRHILQHKAQAYAHDEAKPRFGAAHEGSPSASQWGALRQAALSIADEDTDLSAVAAWLGYAIPAGGGAWGMRVPIGAHAMDPWPAPRVKAWGDVRSSLHDLLQNQSIVWTLLGITPQSAAPAPAGADAALQAALWPCAVRMLIDAVCQVRSKGGD